MIPYDTYDIVFQEIPDEVSLAFTIKGCPNRCEGCHSPHLRDTNGEELNISELDRVISKYKKDITCVLFLGGDAYHDELYMLFKHVKSLGYKAAFYSGNDNMNSSLIKQLDYYKIGSYKKRLGGLTSIKTNQRLYRIEDITSRFLDSNK